MYVSVSNKILFKPNQVILNNFNFMLHVELNRVVMRLFKRAGSHDQDHCHVKSICTCKTTEKGLRNRMVS